MPAIMAVSFVAILFFGKRMPRKGSEIGIAAVGACFIIALLSAGSWITHVNDADSAQGTGTEATATADGSAAVGHASAQAAVGGDSERSERSQPTEGTADGSAAVGHASAQAAVGGDSERSERSQPTEGT